MNAGAKSTLFRGQSFLPGLLLILFLVGGASAVWDFFRVDAITRNLALREVSGLVKQVEGDIRAIARENEYNQINHDEALVARARLIACMTTEKRFSDNELEQLADDANLSSIDLIDGRGAWVAGTDRLTGLGPDEFIDILSELTLTGREEMVLGVFDPWTEQDRMMFNMVLIGHYVAAIARPGGGAVVVSTDYWPETQSLGSILHQLNQHPEVLFAMLTSSESILAATKGLPEWVGGPEDSFYDWEIPVDTVAARFTRTPDGEPVFEAVTDLTGLDDVTLRMMLHADELRSIRSRSLVALSIRTVLFMMLGGLILAFLVAKQNQRLLAEERDRIRREVERLEADRRAKERLEAMGKLAGGVAHEIRNPLNTVEMVAQRLELEFEPTSDRDEYLSMVTTMRTEAKRIGKIVQDFLAFARPPATNRQKGSLTDVVERNIALFRPMAEAQGVDITLEKGNVKEFAFDHEQVGQALQNLLRNALEAVPESGGEIRVQLEQEGSYARMEVADNGPGIPLEERVRVFHLYHTTKAEGTGVGLSLVHRIADEHGGRVEIDDTPGGGATLRIYLKREFA
ncbi:GHKL domain-containing protein [bacterium]|nr:GHKL domain-containing protein [bacterium]